MRLPFLLLSITSLLLLHSCSATEKVEQTDDDNSVSLQVGDWNIEANGSLIEPEQILITMQIDKSGTTMSTPKVLLRVGQTGTISTESSSAKITNQIQTSRSPNGVIVEITTTILQGDSDPFTPKIRFLVKPPQES